MSFMKYIKRGIKYVVKDYKQPIVKTEIVQKMPTEMLKDKVIIVTRRRQSV